MLMAEAQRYDRTSKGHDEISAGKKTLPAKLRTVLFLVDGNKDVQDIQRQVLLVGAPADSLSQLATAGYIAPVGAFSAPVAAPVGSIDDEVARFRVAKAFMNDTVVDALGIRAFFFTLKLERCATTADLTALLPEYAQALAKKLERPAIRALVQRMQELIAS